MTAVRDRSRPSLRSVADATVWSLALWALSSCGLSSCGLSSGRGLVRGPLGSGTIHDPETFQREVRDDCGSTLWRGLYYAGSDRQHHWMVSRLQPLVWRHRLLCVPRDILVLSPERAIALDTDMWVNVSHNQALLPTGDGVRRFPDESGLMVRWVSPDEVAGSATGR